MTQTGTPTFVHAIQDGFQHILSVAVAVFLPHGAVFTAEDDEFTIASSQRGEVGDLYDDGPAEKHTLRMLN